VIITINITKDWLVVIYTKIVVVVTVAMEIYVVTQSGAMHVRNFSVSIYKLK